LIRYEHLFIADSSSSLNVSLGLGLRQGVERSQIDSK